jgi:hypothetical protein
VFNYAHADVLLNRSGQALLNFVIIFLGAVLAAEVTSKRLIERDAQIAQGLIVFALVGGAVLFPAMLSLIWLLNQFHIVDVESTRKLTVGAVSAIASAVSAIVAVLNYRRSAASDTPPPSIAPRVV